MRTRTARARLMLVAPLLVYMILSAQLTAFACAVGTGTTPSCTETALDACLPGGGDFDGTVTFLCGGAAVITVTGTKMITADTTIDGGSLITISGGDTVGVFSVAGGIKFTMGNLSIMHGSGIFGSAIETYGTTSLVNSSVSLSSDLAMFQGPGGTLTVIDSAFCNNPGAIGTEGGTLTIAHSTFADNRVGDHRVGAALCIFNGGNVTVSGSFFSGNSAYAGGGAIENTGSLTVRDSMFSANSTTGDGGGILNDFGQVTVTGCTFTDNTARHGGGIANVTGDSVLKVANSTFFANTAAGGNFLGGGGIINEGGGRLTVTNSTFAANSAHYGPGSGGAIYNQNASDPAIVTNSIMASSTAGSNCAVGNYGGTITDGGNNIDDDGSCGLSGTSLSNVSPLFDPAGLLDNGGPTLTVALQVGSPAINAGNESVCATSPVNGVDQRGAVRPGVGAVKCSIGAYEFNSPAPGSSTTTKATYPACPPTITVVTSTTTTSVTTTTNKTTTTTLPCTTARCSLDAALLGGACAGQTIPRGVSVKLSAAENLIDQAATTPGKKARKIRQKAKTLLRQAGAKATRAAKGTKPKITPACAAALKDAAGRVAAGL